MSTVYYERCLECSPLQHILKILAMEGAKFEVVQLVSGTILTMNVDKTYLFNTVT